MIKLFIFPIHNAYSNSLPSNKLWSSNTEFCKQAVWQAHTADTYCRTGTWMDRQAFLIDICSYFSTRIILLGYLTFGCSRADARSPFI